MPRSPLEQTYANPINGSGMGVDGRYGLGMTNFLQRIVHNGTLASGGTATYSVLPNQCGTLFTTRGNTAACTFTLPAVSTLPTGWWVSFFNVSAYGMVIASNGSSDDIVAFNDATADSITCTSAAEIIGTHIKVVWDGTGWLAHYDNGSIATAVYVKA
jgi:hypothetical protein